MVAENETEINDQVENGKISVDQLWTNILSNNAKNQLTLANKRTIILGELAKITVLSDTELQIHSKTFRL